MILGREPVAIAAVIAIAVNLALTFGLNLSAEQVTLINALVVGVLALIARSGTTPMSHPTLPTGTSVTVEGTQRPDGTSDKVVIAPTPPGPAGVDAGVADGDYG